MGRLATTRFHASSRALDPESFAAMLARFTTAFGRAARKGGGVALDGMACRRGYEAGRAHAPPVMVSAWGADLRMTLVAAPADNGAEAAAALEVIALPDVAGAIVTADALQRHRRMAAAITAAGGDYMLALKGNQPGLVADAEACIAAEIVAALTVETTAHGRTDRRTAPVADADAATMAQDHDFPGLAAIVCIETERCGARPGTAPLSQFAPLWARPGHRRHTRALGASKTACTRCLTSSCAKTTSAPARTMRPTISPSCADLPLTPGAPSPIPKHHCADASSAPDGTTPTSSTSSPKCASPACGAGLGVGVIWRGAP